MPARENLATRYLSEGYTPPAVARFTGLSLQEVYALHKPDLTPEQEQLKRIAESLKARRPSWSLKWTRAEWERIVFCNFGF